MTPIEQTDLSVNKLCIDIAMRVIQHAGLSLEFHDFYFSPDNPNANMLEAAKEFCKKYPDKFHAPKENE